MSENSQYFFYIVVIIKAGWKRVTPKEIQPVFLDEKACYAALCAHDTRFDGRFFVGVSSTGIY